MDSSVRTHLYTMLVCMAIGLIASVTPVTSYAGQRGAAVQGPVAIPAESYCTECGMLVRPDSLFVSEILNRDGKAVYFCDLGDMMLYYEKHASAKASVVYVKDYTSGSWADGRKAFYLSGAKVRTPMRYGILAFGSRAFAEKHKKEKGGDAIHTFDEAIAAGIFK